MTIAKRYKPYSEVRFFTEVGELVVHATNNTSDVIDNDVISINTSRDMGADAPTFSINLSRRKMWHKLISSNDLVTISMCRPPEKDAVVFVGLVDDARRRTVVNEDGTPERVITITGRGVSKAFIQFDIGLVPESEGNVSENGNFGFLDAVGVTLVGQTPDVILSTIWDTLATKHMNYEWSTGIELFKIAKYNFKPRPGVVMMDSTGLVNCQGSLWALMKEVGESPFFELYWEIVSGYPTLILRPTPFSKEDWVMLPQFEITDEHVVMDEIGRSDIETYTLYSVGMKALFAEGDAYKTTGLKPLWNEAYSKKYGIRRLHTESAYTAVADNQIEETADVMRKLQTDLYNWNIKNNSMYNGTLIVMGSNQYKVGHKLQYKSVEDGGELTYYIRSVTHNFVNFSNWVTQLGVVRGLPEQDRFTAPYGDMQEYTSMGFTPFNPFSSDSGAIYGTDLEKADAVVKGAIALKNTGKIHYVFGGNSVANGALDCSSFTQYIYRTYAGMDIGRTAETQSTMGTLVPRSSLSPGDLVFFQKTYSVSGASHVGIFLGDGNIMHCSSSADALVIVNLEQYIRAIGGESYYYKSKRVLTPKPASGINKYLERGLAGYGAVFEQEARANKLDLYLLLAISIHETGRGKNTSGNNVGGMMKGSGGKMTFRTMSAGIAAMAKNLRVLYIEDGLVTIPQIGSRYCPIGASNDPNGLNKYWVGSVTGYYNNMKAGKSL
jgi:hypothetical protein